MPEIKKYRAGVPCWVDVSSTDLAAAAEFYSTLFGWEPSDQGEEAGHYHLLRKGGRLAVVDAEIRDAGNGLLNAKLLVSWTLEREAASEGLEAD